MTPVMKNVSPSSASEGSFKIRTRPYENSPCYDGRYPEKILLRTDVLIKDDTADGEDP